jgi:ApbE superfamily uncharacterized protein (UPF0280 family)
MKKSGYQRRFYREWARAQGLCRLRLALKETDLEILTDRPLDKTFAQERLRLYRWQIENYISRDPRFLASLKPLAVELRAPAIVRAMAAAAAKAGVGPMAAVAGAIAGYLGRDLLKKGCREVIIENGGDIFLKLKAPRRIAVYSGRRSPWRGLNIMVRPNRTPLGICTSSGRLGHSLSFGLADSVVIMARDPALSDAMATAVCNRIKTKKDLSAALDFARSIPGVRGVLVIFKKQLASWGKIELAA